MKNLYPYMLQRGDYLLAFRTHGEINECLGVVVGVCFGDDVIVLIELVVRREREVAP